MQTLLNIPGAIVMGIEYGAESEIAKDVGATLLLPVTISGLIT